MSIFAGTNGYLDDIARRRRAPLRGRAARGLPHPLPRPARPHPHREDAARRPGRRRQPSSRPSFQVDRRPTRAAIDPTDVDADGRRRRHVATRRWRRSDGAGMAGGQERILRRPHPQRPVHEEDHARHGADRRLAHRAGPAARRRRRALQRPDHRGRARPRPRPAAQVREPAAAAARPEIRQVCYVVIVADRGLCGAYNSTVLRAAEREIKQDVLAGLELLARRRRPEGRELLPLPRLPHRRASFTGFTDNPTYADARAHRRAGPSSRFLAGEVDRVRARLHPLRLGRHPGGRAAGRSSRSSASCSPTATPRPTAAVPRPTTSSSRRPPSILDELLPRYVEARDLRRPARRRRLRARRPPAGHEGGHRQRRRAHQRPSPAS